MRSLMEMLAESAGEDAEKAHVRPVREAQVMELTEAWRRYRPRHAILGRVVVL